MSLVSVSSTQKILASSMRVGESGYGSNFGGFGKSFGINPHRSMTQQALQRLEEEGSPSPNPVGGRENRKKSMRGNRRKSRRGSRGGSFEEIGGGSGKEVEEIEPGVLVLYDGEEGEGSGTNGRSGVGMEGKTRVVANAVQLGLIPPPGLEKEKCRNLHLSDTSVAVIRAQSVLNPSTRNQSYGQNYGLNPSPIIPSLTTTTILGGKVDTTPPLHASQLAFLSLLPITQPQQDITIKSQKQLDLISTSKSMKSQVEQGQGQGMEGDVEESVASLEVAAVFAKPPPGK